MNAGQAITNTAIKAGQLRRMAAALLAATGCLGAGFLTAPTSAADQPATGPCPHVVDTGFVVTRLLAA